MRHAVDHLLQWGLDRPGKDQRKRLRPTRCFGQRIDRAQFKRQLILPQRNRERIAATGRKCVEVGLAQGCFTRRRIPARARQAKAIKATDEGSGTLLLGGWLGEIVRLMVSRPKLFELP